MTDESIVIVIARRLDPTPAQSDAQATDQASCSTPLTNLLTAQCLALSPASYSHIATRLASRALLPSRAKCCPQVTRCAAMRCAAMQRRRCGEVRTRVLRCYSTAYRCM
eukprot:6183383-Pleurochrysis_carterae.AAC.1